MMYYMGNYREKQVYEGIDKITLLFRVPWNRYLNPILFQHKYIKLEKRQNLYTTYYYLTIHGEFINHKKDIADCITDAVLLLIKSEALLIQNMEFIVGEEEPYFSYKDIPRIIIYCHLDLLFAGISELEFFHDFPQNSFVISPDTKIIKTNMSEYSKILGVNISLRNKCLIKYRNTYYTNDFRGNKRHSVIDFYNRTQKLLEQNNQYPRSLLEKKPITRLEFRCVRNNLYQYLTIYNLYGSYNKVFYRFSSVFTRLYKKYMLDLVNIDTTNHPNFNKIYLSSKDKHIKYEYKNLFKKVKKIPDCDKCDYIFYRIIKYYYTKNNSNCNIISEYPYPEYDLFHPTCFIDDNDLNFSLALLYSNDNYINSTMIDDDNQILIETSDIDNI